MKIQQETLSKALSLVGVSLPGKTLLPVLNSFLFEVDEKKVTITTTNLSSVCRCSISCTGSERFRVLLPVNTSRFVDSLPSDLVDIELETPNKIKLSCHKTVARFNLQDVLDYPPIPEVQGDGVKISGSLLKTVIRSVIFAAAGETARPILSGVLFDLSGSSLTLTGADGFRLATSTVPLLSDKELKFIIPIVALRELMRVLDSSDNWIITLSGNRVKFEPEDGGIYWATQQLVGIYPDYQKLIRKEHVTVAIISLSELLSTFRSVVTIGDKDVITFTIGNSVVSISQNGEYGDCSSEILAITQGPDIQFRCISSCIEEFLASATKESQIRVCLETPTSPVQLELGDNYKYIIKPQVS